MASQQEPAESLSAKSDFVPIQTRGGSGIPLPPRVKLFAALSHLLGSLEVLGLNPDPDSRVAVLLAPLARGYGDAGCRLKRPDDRKT